VSLIYSRYILAYEDGTVCSEKLAFNPLNAQVNPICHLLAFFGAHHILHVSRIRVKLQMLVNHPVRKNTT
jgi:hypothetical protein